MKNLAWVALAGCLAMPVVGCSPGDAYLDGGWLRSAKVAVRGNCGGDKYVDEDGVQWLADRETPGASWRAIGGETVQREGMTIPGKRGKLYLTERYGMDGYQFALANGTYMVRLHFAETYGPINKPGMRCFSVKVNGQPVLTKLDVFQEAGGFAKPLIRQIDKVAVTDGKLKIEFEASVQKAEINAIEVLGW